MEWRSNATEGRIVAGGNGEGNRMDQLNGPTDVIIDPQDNSLIITDRYNRRVMRCSRENSQRGQIIISDIDCRGLALHKDGSLYVSDCKKNEVRRWKKGESQGTIVAGGNAEGNQLNQLHGPTFLFVTDDHTLYVSDTDNHRVMKWTKDAKEGIVVAGGHGQGNQTKQLSSPRGLLVDHFGQIYVADFDNHRVMRWCDEAKEGIIVVGGNTSRQKSDQLNYPVSLSLDEKENLYVAYCFNHRIQKYYIQ